MTAKKTIHHGNYWMAGFYVVYYGILKKVAKKHGYALAVHGTVSRDLDLIAIPWTDKATSTKELINAFVKKLGAVGIKRTSGKDKPTKKPHGRIAYSIHIGGGGYIDISVMPKTEKDGVLNEK